MEITDRKDLQAYFQDALEDYNPAIQQVVYNGLTYLFVVQKREPPLQRYDNATGVALIELTQIGAGIFITTETIGGGTALSQGMIMERVSDVIVGLRAAVRFPEYSTQFL